MTVWNHGDEVMVSDDKGNYEFRGKVVGRHKIVGGDYIFDVQPNRAESMSRRICGIPSSRLRGVSKPILAYERRPTPAPKHVLDHA